MASKSDSNDGGDGITDRVMSFLTEPLGIGNPVGFPGGFASYTGEL